MIILNHLSPGDHKLLSPINDEWPLQFLSEFTRFHKNYYNEKIGIVYDKDLRAYLPIRFLRMKMFRHAQIMHAPFRNAVELSASEQQLFFRQLITFLKDNHISERLIQPHPYGILASHPAESRFCEFGTYVIDLQNQSEEEILEKFHLKYQKAISHSIKNGAVVKLGKDTLDDFYTLYAHTMERARMPADDMRFFKMQYDYLTDRRACSGVVYEEGRPVSGIFVIHSKYSAFLTHAGTMGESKLYGAAKLLNYEMMRHMKSAGVKRYDFVGVRLNNTNPALEGIFRFKKGFGGDLKSGYLWKTDLDPGRAMVYDSLMKIKLRGRKVSDIIDQVSS